MINPHYKWRKFVVIQQFRKRISWIFIVALVALIALSESALETEVPFLTPVLFLLGCVFVGIASLGRLWCSLYIAGYKTDVLVTEGPYSICRNPLYFFSLIGAVGIGFASETLTLAVVLLLGFATYYPLVIKSEEKELMLLHGDKFKTYLESVPRFFPNLLKLREPEEYVVKPVVYKRHMFDALWFIWLVGIMEVVEALHELHVLPAVFRFY